MLTRHTRAGTLTHTTYLTSSLGFFSFNHPSRSIPPPPLLQLTVTMLLRFSETDLLNTALVDTATGQRVYTILSRATYIRGNDSSIVDVASRTTSIINIHGKIIATINWTGKEKRSAGLIQFFDDQPIKFSELFDGCDSVKCLYVLDSIPTCFLLNLKTDQITSSSRAD